MAEIEKKKEVLKNLRNECLFNSFVMFEVIRRKKDKIKKDIMILKSLNATVILLTLIAIVLSSLHSIENLNYSNILSVGALLLAILIFILFPKEEDTRIAFNTANSF